jgi:hypothetical protein
MNRQQAAEVLEQRRKIVSERILRNLAYSPAHAHLGALQRMEKADQLAFEILMTPVDEFEEKVATRPDLQGLTPDLFFLDQEE